MVVVCVGYGTWFSKPKGGGRGRGVKEKDTSGLNLEVVKDGVVPSFTVASGNTQVENTRNLSSGPSLAMQDTTSSGKSSYANLVYWISLLSIELHGRIRCYARKWSMVYPNHLLILKKWHSDENLLKEDVSTITVWVKLHCVPVMAFSEDGLSATAIKLGTPLMLDSYTFDMCMQSWGRSSYARVMIKLRADVELKNNIIVAMPKIIGEGHYLCNVRVEYEWKPPRCASCKVFGHIHEECLKNTGVGEKKTSMKPSQNSQVLNSVDVDMELGTNGGTTNLVNNEATSSGSSFMNIDNSSTGTTPIIDKIRKFEELLTSGKATLVDEARNPLKKVEFSDDFDSEDEVASVDNDMARSMASEKVGFGTQSLLEQWRDSYVMVTMMKTHMMMICMKVRIILKSFKLYVIIWISEFEDLTQELQVALPI
ncbi:RNA-directed DNA polymerase, eukaryota, reverse transcriptase zinc-binding domain protein [Tanacetum coccineum]